MADLTLKRCDLSECGVSGAGAGWWEIAYGGGPLLLVYPVGKIPEDVFKSFFEAANRFHFCGREHALDFLREKMTP